MNPSDLKKLCEEDARPYDKGTAGRAIALLEAARTFLPALIEAYEAALVTVEAYQDANIAEGSTPSEKQAVRKAESALSAAQAKLEAL